MSWNGYENNVLLRNDGCGEDGIPRFTDVAMALGADDPLDSRGLAVADFDNDGDLDLAINHNPGDNDDLSRRRATLLRNEIGQQRPWLAVELAGTRSNRDAAGAEVTVEAGGRRQLKLVKLGASFASQLSRRLYFGLGEAEEVESLTVRWPDGSEESFRDLPARRLVRIEEGRGFEVVALPGPAPAMADSIQPAGGGAAEGAASR